MINFFDLIMPKPTTKPTTKLTSMQKDVDLNSVKMFVSSRIDELEAKFTDVENQMESKFKNVIQKELQGKIATILSQMEEFKSSMTFMNENYERMRKENEELKNEVIEMKKEQVQTKKLIEELKIKPEENSQRVNEIDNFLRLNNVEIHGVPIQQNENTANVATSIFKIIDPDSKTTDIEVAFRKTNRRKSDDNGPSTQSSPIIVKMKCRQKRMDIYRNKKRLAGYNFNSIGINAQKVFVNENLSPWSKQLFYKTNELRKKNAWKSIWSSNGFIKVKMSDESPIITIRSEADLTKITPNLR